TDEFLEAEIQMRRSGRAAPVDDAGCGQALAAFERDRVCAQTQDPGVEPDALTHRRLHDRMQTLGCDGLVRRRQAALIIRKPDDLPIPAMADEGSQPLVLFCRDVCAMKRPGVVAAKSSAAF